MQKNTKTIATLTSVALLAVTALTSAFTPANAQTTPTSTNPNWRAIRQYDKTHHANLNWKSVRSQDALARHKQEPPTSQNWRAIRHYDRTHDAHLNYKAIRASDKAARQAGFKKDKK